MESNKKTIILSAVIVLLLIGIIILSIIKKSAENNDNMQAIRLSDSKEFFTINNLVNEDTSKSIYSYYVSTEIYYKKYDLYTTYFIKGYTAVEDETLTQEITNDNVNYLIKIKGAAYELKDLDSIYDIKKYADEYNDNNEFNSNKIVPTYSYNEKNKLIYYLTLFNKMLYNDTNEAYNKLTDNQKNKYSSLEDFKNKINSIKLSTYITNYTAKEKGDETVYNITTKKNNITIYEKYPMDYILEY